MELRVSAHVFAFAARSCASKPAITPRTSSSDNHNISNNHEIINQYHEK